MSRASARMEKRIVKRRSEGARGTGWTLWAIVSQYNYNRGVSFNSVHVHDCVSEKLYDSILELCLVKVKWPFHSTVSNLLDHVGSLLLTNAAFHCSAKPRPSSKN